MRTDPLRFIAVRLALPDLAQVVREPGVSEAYRVTIQYQAGQHPDQVATLAFMQSGGGSVSLTVYYRREDDRPLILTPILPLERCRAFAAALRALAFDRLDDMPELPWHGADIWLIERASGSFHHDVLLSPDAASGVHLQIVTLLRGQAREMVRAIQ